MEFRRTGNFQELELIKEDKELKVKCWGCKKIISNSLIIKEKVPLLSKINRDGIFLSDKIEDFCPKCAEEAQEWRKNRVL